MDRNFEEFRDHIEKISDLIKIKDENYFKTIEELEGKVDFYQEEIQDDGDADSHKQIDQIISKFENLQQTELN